MAIVIVPPYPQRNDPNFATIADSWNAQLPTWTDQVNATALDVTNKQIAAAVSEMAAELAETNAETAQGLSEAARDLSIANASGSVANGSSIEWANKTTGVVAGGEYSAKEYAIGTNVPSAKKWAITAENVIVDSGEYSAKHWATKAAASVAVLPSGTINDLLTAADKTWSSNKITSAIFEGRLIDQSLKTSTYTILETDRSKLINCSGSFTIETDNAASLGNGWFCYIRNIGSSNITIDPYSTQTIDSLTTGIIEHGDTYMILCDGSNLSSIKISPERPHYITSSQTWTCPIGIYSINVELWGGGGSGGKLGTTGYLASGGNGGGYSSKKISISPGTSKTITIGVGGAGQTVTNTDGNVGGTSSFSSDITCPGGSGGNKTTDSITTLNTSPTGGDINLVGEQGSSFLDALISVGGGTVKTPNIKTEVLTVNGNSGLFPGGGGTGVNNAYTSGPGAAGLCIIWY